MADLSEKSRTQLVIDLMFHALRVGDGRMNECAAEALRRLGLGAARLLVIEALRKKNSPPHRLRALGVLGSITQLSGPDDWMDLTILAADKNSKVRRAAAECPARHSPATFGPAGAGPAA